jgi:hypothetical protein
MREMLSSVVKSEANAIHKIMIVANVAARAPYSRSTNVLTIYCEFCASRHGTTPRMLVCMARYSAAIPTIEIRIVRGMLRSGSRTSAPRLQMW